MLLEVFAMKTNRFSVVLGDEIMIGRRVTDLLLASRLIVSKRLPVA